MSLEILALLDLPIEGQRALIASKKEKVIRALATNQNVDGSIVDNLLESKDASAVYRALRLTDRKDYLVR